MSDDSPIKLKVEDGIAHFILDRPPENRMNKAFLECMCHTIQALKDMSGFGAVVLYGSGRHFSVGADVDYLKSSILEQHKSGMNAQENIFFSSDILRIFETLDVPTIAAINGLCMGSGLELALACDMRICASNSIMGSPEISWEIITGLGGSIRLEKLVGRPKTLELLLSGTTLTSEEAYNIGMVNRVTERKEVIPYALRVAKLFSQEDRHDLNAVIKRSIPLR